MNISPLIESRLIFWQYIFYGDNRQNHHGYKTKQWHEVEKNLSKEAEGLMLQALKLWQIGEQEWASRICLQAHQKRSDWWLPQAFLGNYYVNKDIKKARQWLQAAYRSNPVSLPLALKLLGTYSASESPELIHDLLQSFPEEQQIQDFYLEMLQRN